MYSVITQNHNDAQYLTRIIADSINDLPADSNFSPGSTAIIADSGDEYMLNNQRQWFKYVKKSSGGDSAGIAFTPMGTVSSIDDLPATGNRAWDVYMVGPNADGSYDEYYWTLNNAWELMGKSIPNLDDVIREQVLYSGDDGLGTIEVPEDGTILKVIYDKIAAADQKAEDAMDAIEGIEFKRLNAQQQEDDFINQISVLVNDQVVNTFFSPSTVINTQSTFVAEELVDFFIDNNITPTTYDGNTWTAAQYPITDMTEANGPYLVLITNTNAIEQYHIKNLHQIFINTITNEVKDLDDIKEMATTITTLEQDVQDIKDTLNTLEESSTLEII